jgi:hypothetical protein
MDTWVCRTFRILILAVAAACTPATADTLEGRVVGVSDGDTITVLDSDKHPSECCQHLTQTGQHTRPKYKRWRIGM